MKNTDLTPFIEILITVLSLIVTRYMIPWLKEKLSVERLDKLIRYTKIAVQAAEQLYGGGTGESKKEYVLSFLDSKGFSPNTEDISAIIESAVYQLPYLLTQSISEKEKTPTAKDK